MEENKKSQEEIIQSLLNLGFKDKTRSVANHRFVLDTNDFYLQYEKGKFNLIGNGGHDDSGELELDHLQIEDIKPLYKLLTGKPLQEGIIYFNYKEWGEKLKKEEEARNEAHRKYLSKNPAFASLVGRYPIQNDIDIFSNMAKIIPNQTTYVHHEEGTITKSEDGRE